MPWTVVLPLGACAVIVSEDLVEQYRNWSDPVQIRFADLGSDGVALDCEGRESAPVLEVRPGDARS